MICFDQPLNTTDLRFISVQAKWEAMHVHAILHLCSKPICSDHLVRIIVLKGFPDREAKGKRLLQRCCKARGRRFDSHSSLVLVQLCILRLVAIECTGNNAVERRWIKWWLVGSSEVDCNCQSQLAATLNVFQEGSSLLDVEKVNSEFSLRFLAPLS